jgi:vancomycin resistance protein YoaR
MRLWLSILLAGLGGLVAGLVLSQAYFADRIYPGVAVAGVNLGGLSRAQAQQVLQKVDLVASLPRVEVVVGDQVSQRTPAQLGWSPNLEATVQAAFESGRSWADLSARLRGLLWGIEIPVLGQVDTERLKKTLRTLVFAQYRPAVNARLVLNTQEYQVTPEQQGQTYDWAQAMEQYLANSQLTRLELLPRVILPSVKVADLQPSIDQVNALLKPLTLVYLTPAGTRYSLEVSVGEVAQLVVPTVAGIEWKEKPLKALLARLERYNQPARDARYVLQQGRYQVQAEKAGYALSPEAAEQAIRTALLAGSTQVTLPVLVVQPAVLAANLPQPAQLSLLAAATTSYTGSARPRITNVEVAAAQLNGYVVPAGNTFSFNKAIGKISLESGFKDALVISGGRTVEGLGGGVCQVSTTAFRALYKAGLPIVERHPHAYAVRYYGTPGFDAAIYQPSLDLRMKNDTGAPLLISARTDPAKRQITVEVWGQPQERTVKVSAPVILSTTPAPPARYQQDASLAPGVRRQVDWAAKGYRTQVTRTITTAQSSRTDTLSTSYRPWQAVYLVGPSSNRIPQATPDRAEGASR